MDHLTSESIDVNVINMINKLALMQALKKAKTPLKAKKRIIAGIMEVYKTLHTTLDERRCRLLIIAINNQENNVAGGLDFHIRKLISLCKEKNIPVVHACSRKMLGLAFTGKGGVKISVISVINYQGCADLFTNVLTLVEEGKRLFQMELLGEAKASNEAE